MKLGIWFKINPQRQRKDMNNGGKDEADILKIIVENAHMAGQNYASNCNPSAYEAFVYWENVVKKQNLFTSIICPFCNENNFDKIGLKYHLETYCYCYNSLTNDQTKKSAEK